MNPRFILASNSPRRRQLLSMIGMEFEVIVSDCNENTADGLLPAELVKELAFRKAEDVEKRTAPDGDYVIIGADTVVADGARILGKPTDRDDAVNTLLSLSGKTHSVFTGIALVGRIDGKSVTVTDAVETEVTFADISRAEAEFYADTGEPMDKAGSYAAQGIGGFFVTGLNGDYYNVVGLPISRIRAVLLDSFGLKPESYIGRRTV